MKRFLTYLRFAFSLLRKCWSKPERLKIGEELILKGKIQPEDIQEVLEKQRKYDLFVIEREEYGIRLSLFLSNRTLVALLGAFTSLTALAWNYLAELLRTFW